MSLPVRGPALVVVWSSGFIGAELGARCAGPDTVLAWRCLVTAAVLLPWAVPALRNPDRWEWARQAVLALLCQCLYLGGVFGAAAAGVPAGTSALIASLQPALVLTATAVLGAQRLPARHLAGVVLGTAGVALTAAGDLRAGVSAAGVLLPLAAMLSLTTGTLLQHRWSQQPRPTPALMPTLALQSLVTAGFFVTWAGARGHLAPPATVGFAVAVTWTVGAGIGSYGLYYLVTARDGAARASTLLYLTPAGTGLWATLMFGEPVRAAAVVGLLVSACAVVLLHPRQGSSASSQVGPSTTGPRAVHRTGSMQRRRAVRATSQAW